MSFDSRAETWTHIHEVQKNIRQVGTELTRRALEHDQSKLHSPEVEILNETSVRLREIEYDSPEYYEALKGLKPFTDHHYAVNDHHPEYHTRGIHGMNLIQLIELLADWYAAGKRHPDGNLYDSIIANQERFGYDNRFRDMLIDTAITLNWIPS